MVRASISSARMGTSKARRTPPPKSEQPGGADRSANHNSQKGRDRLASLPAFGPEFARWPASPLAMLVSSTSMKAASETTTAMSHGLTSALAAGTNSLAAPSVVMDRKDSLELSCGGGRV